MSAIQSSQLRPGEKRDRTLGTIMIGSGIALIVLSLFMPLFVLVGVPRQLASGSYETTIAGFIFLTGGYRLRNSYADNLGESPEFRTPRARRIDAAILFAIGVANIAYAAISHI